MTSLSVLDLVPVRSDQTTSDAFAATLALARTADRLGFTRFWTAEHHNMPAVAATNPAVLAALLVAATGRIRVGSGGVMLPNHAPLVVAEQFALLEAAHPGRIDLGIGRAPGTDPVTARLLRRAGSEEDPAAAFPRDVQDVLALLGPDGVRVRAGDRTFELRSTPEAASSPEVWLLGSSLFSAQLAAELGLPYVFAHHFAGRGAQEALEVYRSRFRPGAAGSQPRTIAVVNAVVAETAQEAADLALPQLRTMSRLRTGEPLQRQALVEDALGETLTAATRAAIDAMSASWVVGGPDEAAEELVALAGSMGTDEVMVVPAAGAHVGTDPRRAGARERTLELLADRML